MDGEERGEEGREDEEEETRGTVYSNRGPNITRRLGRFICRCCIFRKRARQLSDRKPVFLSVGCNRIAQMHVAAHRDTLPKPFG
eukprot:4715191-Pyramimonas_sp.AAC.1